MSSTSRTSSPSMLSSKSFEMRTTPGAPLRFEKLDLHRDIETARRLRQEKDGPFQNGDQRERAPLVIPRDLSRDVADAFRNLFLREQHALDSGRGHASTGRSAKPYLKIRFSKS